MFSENNWTPFLLIAVLVIAALAAVSFTGRLGGDGSIEKLTPQEYASNFVETDSPHLLIDVRTPAEFATGSIEGAVNIPVDSITQHLDQIPDDQPVVLYCRSGNRSMQAARKLESRGYSQLYDLGGVGAWQSAGYALQTPN